MATTRFVSGSTFRSSPPTLVAHAAPSPTSTLCAPPVGEFAPIGTSATTRFVFGSTRESLLASECSGGFRPLCGPLV